MDRLLDKLFEFCQGCPHLADAAIKDINYGLSRYGYHPNRDYWRDLVRNSDDKRLLGMKMSYSDFFDIMEADGVEGDYRKQIGRGVGKLLRAKVFRDATLVNDDLLLKLFLDEINERGDIKTSYNSMRCSDYLWYVSFEGRLGRVKRSSVNCKKLLKAGKIALDRYGVSRAKMVLNRCGCEYVRQRPILKSLSRGKWSKYVMDKLADMLDGGHELEYVIDTNFKDAYEPDYDENVYIDDLVTSKSCMSGRGDEAQSFYGHIDGCYVMRFLKDGDDIGRCIMYEYNGIRHFIRIYCQPEYQRDCLFTLRKQMKENDLLGRDARIGGIHLHADFDSFTDNMYLDGGYYGIRVEDGELYVVDRGYDCDCESTSSGTFADVASSDGVHQCYDCGKWLSTSRDDYIYDEEDEVYYCCEDHAANNDLIRCEYCDEYHHCDISTEDGYNYCCERCAENAGYICTRDTEKWIHDDEAFEVDGYYYESEEGAIEDGWTHCVECDSWMKVHYPCIDGKPRCSQCLTEGGWTLKYVKDDDNVKEEE